ncbi:MAG TPA: lipopolysaccharide biosynthesis protein [Stellaceae bacterium]|nr:lipopolysaccharide biosynthesis protein [Stellaceae bacterium]
MRDYDAALRTDHLLADLGRRSVRGGAVTFVAQAGKVVLQFVTVAVLARLLPPAAFGLIAMVAALNTIFDLIKDFGLSAATIRKSDLTHAEVTALFWINAACGALIAAMLIAAAPVIASIYGEPALVGVTRCLAIGFVFSGLSVQHWALLRRQMRFTVVAAVDVGSEVTGFLAALSLAVLHAGYWALVAQRLAVPAVALLASWSLCSWRPGLPRRVAGLGALLRFGVSVTGVNVAGALTRSLDQVVVGFMWGPGALGLYERAAKLLLTPTLNLVVPLYSVTLPLMSRLELDRERYRRVFGEIVETLAMAVMPGAALIAVTSDWVVAVMFGAGWGGAAPLVAGFAIAAAYQPVAQLVGVLYLTQDRKREMLRAAFVDAALFVVAVLTGLPFGTLAVAAALATVGWALRLPVALYLATRRGPVTVTDLAAAVVPAATSALVTAGTTVALRHFVLAAPVEPVVGLAAAAGTALTSAVATLSVFSRSRRRLIGLMRIPQSLWRGKSALPV